MSLDDARAKLMAHFSAADGNSSTENDNDNDKWSRLWDAGDFLPWDRGCPNPALEDVLKDRQDILGSSSAAIVVGPSSGHHGADAKPRRRTRKKALVPGCGRGYDVLLLASFGYDAYGLDVSESAVRMCDEYTREHAKDYPARGDEGVGEVRFVVGDFFKDDWVNEVLGGGGGAATAPKDGDGYARGVFDLLYDYTFLSALPPNLRPAWSLRCLQLLSAEPLGHLICVEFPTYKPPSTKGPPYGLPPKVYLGHLSHPGKKLPYDNEDNLLESDIHDGATEGGLERIVHWQPERTHEIGKGTDWVSIWRHRQ
ncbi:MAG: hypothetical protein M1837_000171 [Sclerophora amabilis]|nr:MAG: hypothetical protein M1837_000171 [Sclerophora amabilis]